MKLTMVGVGYVGIVSGTGFASLGNDVICLDTDEKKIDMLKNGRMTIYEPGLEELFKTNLKAGRLAFTTDSKKAIQESEVIFICVGTPAGSSCEADLSAVKSVAEAIGTYMNDYKVVVNKSTVPVGTADMVRMIIKENQQAPLDFDVVSNPEFLREGAAVKDFENPDRIIIGTNSPKAEKIMTSLYRSLARTGRPIMFTDIRSAEIIKYASNCMLATRISFMNQLSHLCEKAGADIAQVAKGIGLDTRIGARFLHAGIGYGGSCFPKDVKALIATMKKYRCDADLFEAVDRINEKQNTIVVEKLQSVMPIEGITVAIWGVSFKPKTDDIREAPAIKIIRRLQEHGASIRAYDPVATENAKKELKNVHFFDDPYKTLEGCEALVVATEWDLFRNIDLEQVKKLLKKPVIIDGRNIYPPETMKELGFNYIGIGRR
jgi:UDPglucose 6-dehydrogenase